MLPPRMPYWGHIRSRKLWIRFLLVLCFIFIVAYSVQIVLTFIGSSTPSGRWNYFLEGNDHLKLGFIVNTPTCRILNLSAWDKSILPFLSKQRHRGNCIDNKKWTYTHNSNLIINLTDLYKSGYTMKSVSCCYRSIKRVQQSPDDYNDFADLQITAEFWCRYSQTCKPIQRVTPMTDEYIRVICISKYWPLPNDVVYRNFHAVPLAHISSKTARKLTYWSNKTEGMKTSNQSRQIGVPSSSIIGYNPTSSTHSRIRREDTFGNVNYPSQTSHSKNPNSRNVKSSKFVKTAPPNVVLLGIDSMSRLSFQRNMKKTRMYLQEIGAVEMLGYTKGIPLGGNGYVDAFLGYMNAKE